MTSAAPANETTIRTVERAATDRDRPATDLEAERVVIATLLDYPHLLDELGHTIDVPLFWWNPHAKIMQAILDLWRDGQAVERSAVIGRLHDMGQFYQIDAGRVLPIIANETPVAPRTLAKYIVRLRNKARVRAIGELSRRLAVESRNPISDDITWIAAAEQEFGALTQDAGAPSRTVSLGQSLRRVFTEMSEAAAKGQRFTGAATGYRQLDERTAGLHVGDVTIIAARPGMGKSSLARAYCLGVAEQSEGALGSFIVSLEMPSDQISKAILCSDAMVNLSKVRSAMLQAADWDRLTKSANDLTGYPIWIDDTPAIGIPDLRSKIRRIQTEFNAPAAEGQPERKLYLVVVDYLQLMKGTSRRSSSREQEVAEVSRGLKELAKELGVSIVALSQLNRGCEERSDKRPVMSDLRESGSIEQDADNILFIYRDDYYNKETSTERGIAEVIIAKQRNGPSGVTVRLRFTDSCTRFDSLAPGEYPEHDE